MAKVSQRPWKLPGQRTKRKAWGFTAQINGKQVRRYKAEWTRADADQARAAVLLNADQPKPEANGLTLAQAAQRYLAVKARKRSLFADRRLLDHLRATFGDKTLLTDITANRVSQYKAERLARDSVSRKDAEGNPLKLSPATINRPLALLRHLLRLPHDVWGVLEAVPNIRLEKE